jgi:hypothetical protein
LVESKIYSMVTLQEPIMLNYETFTLADALAPHPPIIQLVKGIIPAASITIFYGYPGSLKSSLVMDLAMAIATGQNWLPSMPNSLVSIPGILTKKAPVLWIDLDNGTEVTSNRIAAFSRGYNAPLYTPFYWMSYPTPAIQASKSNSIASLSSHIANNIPELPELIVIDTLLRAAHVKDENSSEMDTVLNNIHKMAEDLKAAIIMISHSNKVNNGRGGNGLRGHSSIEGGVDAVYQVKRDEHSDLVVVENQKARRKPKDPFSARWTFTLDIDQESLQVARFYHEGNQPTKQQTNMANLCQKILDVLSTKGKMNKSELYAEVGGNRQTYLDALDQLIQSKKITKKPGFYKNVSLYECV